MPDAGVKPVIIVEDDLSMSQALERTLRLDVQLPRLGGFELYERMSQRGSPPVIFITAFDDPDVRARANAARAVAFLAKPFSRRTLLEMVDRALKAA
jgi:FixJ family two-component response regulator